MTTSNSLKVETKFYVVQVQTSISKQKYPVYWRTGVGVFWFWVPSIDLQFRYEIYAVIDTGDQFHWDGSTLFTDVMMLFYCYIVGVYLIFCDVVVRSVVFPSSD